jgi:hypothetical protein
MPTALKVVKGEEFAPPDKLGACADLLYTLREQRLQAQKVVDEFARREGIVREHIIAELPKSESQGVTGRIATALIKTKVVPVIKDWAEFYKHVKKTGAFEMLQKRLADAAIQERWEAGKKVPGVEPFTTVSVSVTKL